LSFTAIQKQDTSRKHSRPPLWLRVSISLSLVIFLLGGLYSGYLVYATIREMVARADLPAVPVIQFPAQAQPDVAAEAVVPQPAPRVLELTPMPGESQPAVSAPVQPQVQPLVMSEERVNVLLLGIDRRGGKGWGYRTDTIIIVTVDPINKTAGMLSIPRDLYLPIPGNGEDRINTANVWGYSRKYPGGGPALLKRTIEANFGIPIDYYVMVDFQGFKEIIDTLGGVDVNVPRRLHDTKYPDPKPGDPYGMKTVHFDTGWQHLNGQEALEYARSRMSTSDFDRARRQQQILLAIREKALNIGVVNLIAKMPSLAATMMDSVKTDMTLDEMKELSLLVPDIDPESIKSVVIKKPMVSGYRTEKGGAVQLPKWDLINPVLADMFAAPMVEAPVPTPTQPVLPAATPTLAPEQLEELQELAAEGARIAVQNGTSEPNFAAQVAAMLLEMGYQVVEYGDADRTDYAKTVLVDYTGKNYTLERLIEEFQVAPENVRHSPILRTQIDIRVIVGQDYLLSSP